MHFCNPEIQGFQKNIDSICPKFGTDISKSGLQLIHYKELLAYKIMMELYYKMYEYSLNSIQKVDGISSSYQYAAFYTALFNLVYNAFNDIFAYL